MTRLTPVALAYHAVDRPEVAAPDPNEVVIAPDLLESQLELLLARGYRFVTASELLDLHGPGRPPDGVALVTFDDGWLDQVTVALPILRRLEIRATFFLCPGLWGNHADEMGRAGRVMTPQDVAVLSAAGMEIGAHSVNHPDLRRVDQRTLEQELEGSRRELELIVGDRCRTMAYPFGVSDQRVRDATARAGFELAFRFSAGPWVAYDMPRLPGPARAGAEGLAEALGRTSQAAPDQA